MLGDGLHCEVPDVVDDSPVSILDGCGERELSIIVNRAARKYRRGVGKS